MKKLIVTLVACLLATFAHAADVAGYDSARMEKDLQRLPWSQFKAVISAVPKMKTDIESYGPMGWDFVKTHYQTYAWRKNIGKLDPNQQRQLQELIRKAQAPAAGTAG